MARVRGWRAGLAAAIAPQPCGRRGRCPGGRHQAVGCQRRSPCSGPLKTEQTSRKKLSYKEQRELDALPDRIGALEKEQAEVQAVLADGSVYATDGAKAAKLTARASEIDEELMAALERWTALSA